MNVARTILEQLGGNRFAMMTGAKNFSCGGKDNYLGFRIPRSKGKNGSVNYVKIALNGNDLYDVEYGRIHGMKYTVVAEDIDIYNDMLKDSFENYTGLYTSL